MEIWRNLDFIGFENYDVSTMGRVKSLARRIKTREGVYANLKERILKPSLSCGYLGVLLRKNNKSHYIRVHRLVALAFVENPDKKPHIDHLNGDKLDNRAENLIWVTHRENMKHAKDIGRLEKQKKGKRVAQFTRQLDYLRSYRSLSEASRVSGESVNRIKKSCEGDVWRKGTKYIWQYEDDNGVIQCATPWIYRVLSGTST